MTACRQDAPRFRIGVAQCSDDSWRHKMNDEILREAMFYDGVSVEIRSAADDNRKQAEDVHYFIDEGVDLLIISANEAAPMTPIVEEAYQKGIPVILVDRKILSDKYTAYIGADNYEIGRAVGNYIASSPERKRECGGTYRTGWLNSLPWNAIRDLWLLSVTFRISN